MNALIKSDPSPNALNKLQQSYKEGLSLELEWLGLKKPTESIDVVKNSRNPAIVNAIKEYSKQWRSNVLVEAEANGYYQSVDGPNVLNRIHNLTRDGHVKHVIDWNKRAQLRFDKSLALDPAAKNEANQYIFTETLPNGETSIKKNINYEVLNDAAFFKGKKEYEYWSKGESEPSYYESWTDGIVVVSPKLYDQIQTSVKLPNASMLKPVITVKLPDGGIMLVKSAAQRLNGWRDKKGNLVGSDAPLLKLMENRNLDMVMFTSAAKHTGGVKEYDFDRNLLEKGIYELTEPFVRDSNMKIKETDIRINTGTYENPAKFTKGSKIVRQLATNLSNYLAPDAMDILWKDVYLKSIKGKAEVNDLADKYLKGEKVNLKDIDVNNLSVEKIHDIFVNHGHTELAKKIAKDIVAVEFWADWNSANQFNDLAKLKECEKYRLDIMANADTQAEYNITGIPTVIIFDNGVEKVRFNPNIMFKLDACKKTVQNSVDTIILSKFQ